MPFGPIDVIALEFKDNRFDPEVLAYLTELVSSEVIRILDLVVVHTGAQGEVAILELQDLDEAASRACEPLRAEISAMITLEDIHWIASRLQPATRTAIMVFENLWAVRIKHEMDSAGGRLVLHEPIPRAVVAEALEDLARLV